MSATARWAKLPRVFGGLDPDGEELGGEVAAAGRVEGDHAAVVCGWRGEVPAVVEEALRGVGVSVDDDGGAVDFKSLGEEGWFGKRHESKCSGEWGWTLN